MLSIDQWQNQSVLVTGGTGMVGRHVLETGQQIGATLHVLARTSGELSDVIYHEVDIRDGATVHTIINTCRPTAIIHLAAMGVSYVSGNHPAELLHTNVIGLQNVLEGALSLEKPPKIVIASTGFVYAPQDRPIHETDPIQPFNPYATSTAAAAEVARYYARQLSVSILRLFSLCSPYEKLPRLLPHIIQNAKAGNPIDLTGCEQIRDYAYGGDAAEGLWRALGLDTKGQLEIMNVGSGQSVTLREYVEMVRDILKAHGIDARLNIGARPYRENELMTYVPNIDKMRDRLGWMPKTDLKSGLKMSVEVMLEQIR